MTCVSTAQAADVKIGFQLTYTPIKTMFDAMVARKAFTDKNPEFTYKFVKMVAAADADYRKDPASYGPGTDKAKAIAKVVGGDDKKVRGVLALYDLPTLEQQVSATWLGGGVSKALAATAAFLAEQGKIDKALKSYDGVVTAKYAKMALDGGC